MTDFSNIPCVYGPSPMRPSAIAVSQVQVAGRSGGVRGGVVAVSCEPDCSTRGVAPVLRVTGQFFTRLEVSR